MVHSTASDDQKAELFDSLAEEGFQVGRSESPKVDSQKCFHFVLYQGEPTAAQRLGLPEDGSENIELPEQGGDLPHHHGEGLDLLLHLWRVLSGGGGQVPQVCQGGGGQLSRHGPLHLAGELLPCHKFQLLRVKSD